MRTYAEALEDGEFAVHRALQREAELHRNQLEQERAKRLALAAKAQESNPWLADIAKAPRRLPHGECGVWGSAPGCAIRPKKSADVSAGA